MKDSANRKKCQAKRTTGDGLFQDEKKRRKRSAKWKRKKKKWDVEEEI